MDATSQKVQAYLGISARPVGIKLFRRGEPAGGALFDQADGRKSFCWYVHEAAKGRDFLMRREDLDCNKAEIVLGFREPLFANLEPRVKEKIDAVRIGPVTGADAVMLVLNPEQGMTLANVLPGIRVSFRKNRTVCGEGLAHVYNFAEPTMTLLCIGARTDGAFEPHELLVTLPYTTFLELPSRMGKLASLSRQAIDGMRSRLPRLH